MNDDGQMSVDGRLWTDISGRKGLDKWREQGRMLNGIGTDVGRNGNESRMKQ